MEGITTEILANGVSTGVVTVVLGWFAWNRQKKVDHLNDRVIEAYRETLPLLTQAVAVMERKE